MDTFALLLVAAAVCWWFGHHLPAAAAAFAAVTHLWPQFPAHLGSLIQAAASTHFGGLLVLYGVVFAIPAAVVAWWLGWRPGYRRYAQPQTAAAIKHRASSWVKRDEPPAETTAG